jgi:hypothetical protein
MCNYNNTIESIDYKGHTINIENDDDSSEIFWDDIKNGADGSIFYIYGNRDYNTSDSKTIVERIEKELADKKSDITDYCYYYVLSKEERKEIKEYNYNYGYEYYSIEEMADIIGTDKEELLMRIMDKLHIKYDWYESRGYCQGDYLKVLLVEDNRFIHNRDYVNACLWGGFVGYEIEGEYCDDSCWGFDNGDYAIEEAKSVIDYAIDKQNKKRASKLKELIKNNVDIETRQQILSNY